MKYYVEFLQYCSKILNNILTELISISQMKTLKNTLPTCYI